MRIGITGATGFVGKALLAALQAHGHGTVALLRHEPPDGLAADEWRVIGPVEAMREPEKALAGLDAIVHSSPVRPAISRRRASPSALERP